jgi:hypothetical protein
MSLISFPSDDTQRSLGYVSEIEELDVLKSTSIEIPFTANDIEGPAEFDPRKIIPIVSQGNMGACVGNSGFYCLRLCGYFCGGDLVMLSRMFAYLEAQRASGFFGSDQGAAIIGMAKAAEKVGICLESTFPYPSSYTTRIPKAAYEEAKNYKLFGHTVVHSYAEVFTFLKGRLGGVQFGFPLVRSVDQNRSGLIEELSGPSRGGHAMCWLGISERKDSKGRNYLWGPQTWGLGWGNKGWAEWSPSVVDRIAGGNPSVGFTKMAVYRPQQPTLKDLFTGG